MVHVTTSFAPWQLVDRCTLRSRALSGTYWRNHAAVSRHLTPPSTPPLLPCSEAAVEEAPAAEEAAKAEGEEGAAPEAEEAAPAEPEVKVRQAGCSPKIGASCSGSVRPRKRGMANLYGSWCLVLHTAGAEK
jgi:hypothetical protein